MSAGGYGGFQQPQMQYGRPQGGYGRQMSTGFMQQRSPQMSTGYSVQEQAPQSGGYSGYIPPQWPIFPPQTTTSEGGWTAAGRPSGIINPPQMSNPYQVQEQAPQDMSQLNKPAMMQGPQMSTGNSMQQAPQQTFEQFAQTLGNNGMTSGQMQDAYQKSIQQASAPTNFWSNVGPGGTQNPFPQTPQPFPSNWGNQTFGFDPRSMAGKQVTGDLGWYYGRDAIGRTINNQGDAVANFGRPADGYQRTNPWQRG